MGAVTYFVALPFIETETGDLAAGEAVEHQTSSAAIREAQRLSLTAAGAVAFARSGDTATGEFADAEILRAFGRVPSADELLSAD